MKRNALIWILLAALFLMTTIALAGHTSGNYEITRYSVVGGVGNSSGNTYSLSGTAGQAVSGEMTGDNFELSSGFYGDGGGEVRYKVYLPLVIK